MKDEPAATRLTTRPATAGCAAWIMLLCAAASSCSDRPADRPAATYDEATGRLRSLAFDVNKNGKPDKWDTYRPEPQPSPGLPPYSITSTAIDETGAGRPTRRFTYGARGTIALVEIDRAGNGVFVPLNPPPDTAPPPTRRR